MSDIDILLATCRGLAALVREGQPDVPTGVRADYRTGAFENGAKIQVYLSGLIHICFVETEQEAGRIVNTINRAIGVIQ
jgi:hypothetical protein